ncbi:MAG: hypothetical protein K2W96_22380 [Gemmataceae bacterium]|nr:hypothetical protein [Gemmataceae bacterium]
MDRDSFSPGRFAARCPACAVIRTAAEMEGPKPRDRAQCWMCHCPLADDAAPPAPKQPMNGVVLALLAVVGGVAALALIVAMPGLGAVFLVLGSVAWLAVRAQPNRDEGRSAPDVRRQGGSGTGAKVAAGVLGGLAAGLAVALVSVLVAITAFFAFLNSICGALTGGRR